MFTVCTSDSCHKAIMGTLVMYHSVKVIHVMTTPSTVTMVIRNGTVSTPKIVDAIFFAISVLATPIPYRIALQKRAEIYLSVWCGKNMNNISAFSWLFLIT